MYLSNLHLETMRRECMKVLGSIGRACIVSSLVITRVIYAALGKVCVVGMLLNDDAYGGATRNLC